MNSPTLPLPPAALLTRGFAHVAQALDTVALETFDAFYRDAIDTCRRTLLAVRQSGTTLAEHYSVTRHGPIALAEFDDAAQPLRGFEHLAGSSAALRRLIDAALTPHVAALAGEPLALMMDQGYEKAPKRGAVPPHQDFVAYRKSGPTRFVTAMLALDNAAPADGCLYFAPNYRDFARRRPRHVAERHPYGPIFRYNGSGARRGGIVDEAVAQLDWTAVPVARGDLVVFDAFVPHGAPENRSAQVCRALFFTYNAAAEGDRYAAYYDKKWPPCGDPGPAPAAAG